MRRRARTEVRAQIAVDYADLRSRVNTSHHDPLIVSAQSTRVNFSERSGTQSDFPRVPHLRALSEQRLELAYLAMLEDVGERTDAISDRLIASHWPFVGTDFRRLL